MKDFTFDPADLAPGDSKSILFDSDGLEVLRVSDPGDPCFDEVYRALWQQFGLLGELEAAEVLKRRLLWQQDRRVNGTAMCYELVLVRYKGSFIAARDHAVVADSQGVTVHLSHVLIDPLWRRTGLGGWMRAFPLQTVRRCLSESGLPRELPVTLVAEMEYPREGDNECMARLIAYERAGFRKIDPEVIDYHQPDFRSPEDIDSSGGPVPLRFQLVIRRVDRETEEVMTGAEVRLLVERLYQIYGREFRARDMAVVLRQLASYPSPKDSIRLLPPTG